MTAPKFGTLYSPPLTLNLPAKNELVHQIVKDLSQPKLPVAIVSDPLDTNRKVVQFGPANTPPTQKEQRALTQFIIRFMDEYPTPLPQGQKHQTNDLLHSLFVIV